MAGVVLLHGISRSPRSLRKLERALAGQGYATANLAYPSRRSDLTAIADALAPRVAAFAEATGGPIHFVTHSMGGLVARVLLSRPRPWTMGRVVMLAPPNRGSELADRLAALTLYRWWFGPAGAQLVTRRDAMSAALFGPVDYELGVIAGTRPLYPPMLMPRPSDGPVTVASTRVDGMADHLTLPVSHPFIATDPEAIRQVLAFLAEGRFVHGSPGEHAGGGRRGEAAS